ncbi:hypothetical protein RvY_03420-2 [Ramazzottius varieornatus]|uniref:Uncharacterized protein n=1 Tax=Ramazzottius varieornatus TaxID=947166 RepID=A0A1D1URD7_RAMVA|nr:hypothetical protein RvY_03420-2 [Ramazzottius varieornatus]
MLLTSPPSRFPLPLFSHQVYDLLRIRRMAKQLYLSPQSWQPQSTWIATEMSLQDFPPMDKTPDAAPPPTVTIFQQMHQELGRRISLKGQASQEESQDMSSDCECEESDGSSKQSLEPLQLISPRKAPNPAKENRDLRELQRELKFNNKMGINVLGQKSELSKAMEKMKEQMYKKQLEEEKVRNRSDLERELEKRARRLKEYEHALAEEGGLRYPPLNDEFHRIHAKVNGRFASVPT